MPFIALRIIPTSLLTGWRLECGAIGWCSSIAFLAVQCASDSGSTPFLRDDPWAIGPRWMVASVLIVTAIQLGNPVMLIILMKERR